MKKYSLFGKKIICNLCLPLVEINSQDSDNDLIRIFFHKEIKNKNNSENLGTLIGEKYFDTEIFASCYSNESGYILRIHNFADYVYNNEGTKIDCYPLFEHSLKYIPNLFLHVAFSFSFRIIGLITLHGCSMNYNGNAFIVTGNSGYGKSTLTAYFVSQGSSFMSDDLSIIGKKNGSYLLMSGFPLLRLREDILNLLNLKTVVDSWDYNDPWKNLIKVGHKWGSFETDPTELKVIYIIVPDKKSSQVKISKMSQKDALIDLIGNTSLSFALPKEHEKNNFNAYHKLIKKIPIKKIIYPHDIKLINNIWDKVKKDIESYC